MISHKHKFIFVHIPKCGGTSIESAFGCWKGKAAQKHYHVGNNSSQHHTCVEILKHFPDCKDYFKFAFIRNPFDRLVSEYRYIKSYNKNFNLSFSDLCLDLDKNLRDYAYPYHDKSLCDYLLDNNNYEVVDFIGRLENFQSDFDKICQIIGMPSITLPHHMKTSKSKHYTEYYDNETREIVSEKYAKDIEYFGYKFGK